LNRRADELTAALVTHGRSRFEWGDFDRRTPMSQFWGADRGRCIDRYYIEGFIAAHASDIRGSVLEVHDDDYTRQFGGTRVTRSDVLDIDPTNPRATVIADLQKPAAIADDSYDCIILTQTVHVIFDIHAVVRQCRRILKPGGILLATLACASRIAPEQGLDRDFWRFTASAARRVFGDCFSSDNIQVRSHGNVLVNIAFLYGLACHDLTEAEFEAHDPYFPLIVSVRATK
jgi:SAM-dependent methyltransferase